MRPVSPAFLGALTGTVQPVVRVDVWRGGELVAGDVPVTGGQVQVTSGQAVRSQVDVLVADESGDLTRAIGLPDSAPGAEVQIQMGLDLGGSVELVPLGWFPIQQAGAQVSWQLYDRPGDSVPAAVMGASTLSLTCQDRGATVAADRLTARTQPGNAGVLAEIARLLADMQPPIPWTTPGITDVSVPKSITYDDDRLGAIASLASAAGAELTFDGDGTASLRSLAPDAPVWSVPFGREGLSLSFELGNSLDGVYNGVVARGEDTGVGLPVQAMAVVESGPLAWGGPAGRRPYFYASPLITTPAAAQSAASTRLASLMAARRQRIPITCVANAALEVLDVVSLGTPSGKAVAAQVMGATWPLLGGPMSLDLAVDPDLIAGVFR